MSIYSKKASQVFREEKHTSPFSRVSSFEDAFPTIATVKVVVNETNLTPTLDDEFTTGTTVYDNTHISEYHDCHCPECYNGGVSIGDLLRRMVSSNETESRVKAPCQGRGKKSYGSCTHTFDMSAKIAYKPIN
jgi:hypothetical protein